MAVRGFESDVLENYSLGVLTAILKDRLPDGAVPSSKNSQFYNVGPQMSIFGTRTGCQVQNDDALDGAVVSQWMLDTNSGIIHLMVLDNGDLGTFASGTFTAIGSALFTDPTKTFSWQTANGFAFVTNGAQQFKTDGTDVFKYGISEPDDADWSVSAGSGGTNLPADDYDLVISYFNSDADHEGPISDVKTVTVTAGQKLTVTLPSGATINDAQVDFIKIYIRQQSTSSQFFLVVAGTSPAITATNGWAVGTGSVDIDATEDELLVFDILAPDVNDNVAPPTATTNLQSHKGRMFAAVGSTLYWSNEVGDPEGFNLIDDGDDVGDDLNDPITALAVLGQDLIIFKKRSIYALLGDDPQTWEIQLLDNTVGCTTSTSVGVFDSKLFFMSFKGPQMLESAGSGVADITTQLIGPNFDESHIDPNSLSNAIIIGHQTQDYVAWAITPTGQERNSIIVPFNSKLDRWMASEWNMVDVRSCTTVNDSTGRPWPFIADYDGFVYKVGISTADGLPNGVTSSGTVTGATDGTLSDSTVTWPDLTGRYVYSWNDIAGVRAAQRRRITSNTTTELTLDSNWTTDPIAGDHYAIGGILLDWRSAFRNGGGPFFRKRIEFVFVELSTTAQGITCDVEVYTDLDEDTPKMSRTITVGAGGSKWDEAMFDEDLFASTGGTKKRIPVRTVGYSWQTHIVHMSTGEQLYIYRNGVQWLTKTKKVGQPI